MPDAVATSDAPIAPAHLPGAVFEELEIVKDDANLFHQTIEQVLMASQLVGLRHHQQIILAQPHNEIMVHFPVLMDDGHHDLFKGYRVQHNNALGPYKGGIRYHPQVSLDDIKALARPVWRHRIAETSAAGGAGRDGDVITEILNEVPVPV